VKAEKIISNYIAEFDRLTNTEEKFSGNKQGEDHLNSFVCPDCRDILINQGDALFCENPECSNTERYEYTYMKITGKPTFTIEKDFPDPLKEIYDIDPMMVKDD